MKKLVAVFMVFIMIVGHFIPSFSAIVFANELGSEPIQPTYTPINPGQLPSTQDFRAVLYRQFIAGTTLPTPSLADNAPNDHIYLQFNTNTMAAMGYWQLSYRISPTHEVEITFVRNPLGPNGSMTIEYRLWELTPNPTVPGTYTRTVYALPGNHGIEPGTPTNLMPLNSFLIHNILNTGAPIVPGWVAVSDYYLHGINSFNPGNIGQIGGLQLQNVDNEIVPGTGPTWNSVTPPNPAPGEPGHIPTQIRPSHPQFTIGQGFGFSALIMGRPIHFVWDNEIMEISSSGFGQRIYEFSLRSSAQRLNLANATPVEIYVIPNALADAMPFANRHNGIGPGGTANPNHPSTPTHPTSAMQNLVHPGRRTPPFLPDLRDQINPSNIVRPGGTAAPIDHVNRVGDPIQGTITGNLNWYHPTWPSHHPTWPRPEGAVEERTGIEVEIEIPMTISGEQPTAAVPANIQFTGHSPNAHFFNISIPNVYQNLTPGAEIDAFANPTSVLIGGQVTPLGVQAIVSQRPGGAFFLRVIIDGLPPAVIYNHANSFVVFGPIDVGPNPPSPGQVRAFSRRIFFTEYTLFTLPSFRVVYISGIPFVEVVSFGIAGEYLLNFNPIIDLSSNNQRTAIGPPDNYVLVPATGSESTVLIPIPVQFADAVVQFRVYFAPGGFAIGPVHNFPNTSNTLFSQVLVYRPTPAPLQVNTPQFFNILQYNHTPTALHRHAGHLEMQLQWDVGETTTINDFFIENAFIDEETGLWTVEIDYSIRRSLIPQIEDEDDFATISAVISQINLPDLGDGTMDDWIENRNWTPGSAPATLNPSGTGPATITAATPLFIRYELEQANGIQLVNDGWAPLLSANFRYLTNVILSVDTLREPHTPELFPTPINPLHFPFRFPNIYFLNVMPTGFLANSSRTGNFGSGNLLSPPNTTRTPVNVGASNNDSITINDFDVINIPPVQNLEIVPGSETALSTARGDDVNRVSFDVRWNVPAQQIRDFLRDSYGLPADLSRMEMTLYITQDEQYMRDTFALHSSEESLLTQSANFDRHIDPRIVRVPFPFSGGNIPSHPTLPAPASLFFSDINADGNVMNIEWSAIANTFSDPREALRGNAPAQPPRVVAITGITLTDEQWASLVTGGNIAPLTFRLDGLDVNQRYYLMADIIIHQYSQGSTVGTSVFEIKEASHFSNMVGVTLPGYMEVPDGIDQNPPAPIPLNVRDVYFDRATLYWNRVVPMGGLAQGYTETMEYEIIRIRDNQMNQAHLDDRREFSQVWGSISSAHADIIGLRTENSLAANATLGFWGGTSWSTAPSGFIFNPLTESIEITDNTLQSNTLYFYYVRTVRTVFDGNGTVVAATRSVFSHINVTTSLVQAPRNLMVESGRTDYNRQTEVMISFEAPLTELNYLGATVFIEYQLSVDAEGSVLGQDWLNPVRMNVAFLRQHATAVTDDINWTWFLYHIRNDIRPGLLHSVRVRMIILDEQGNQQFSMWSNVATWLADTDQDQNEEDRLIRDWLDHLREELYRMLRSPYWVIQNNNNAYRVVLRPRLFDEMLRSNAGGQVILPFNMATQTSYYIPASAFITASQQERSFVISSDTMEFVIPSGTIDINNNQSILTISDAIRRNEVDDYFVRININWSVLPQVYGEATITPVADISMAVVAANSNLALWEDRALQALIRRIDELSTLDAYVRNIINGIRGDSTNFELERYILNVLQQAESNFINVLNNYHSNVLAPRALLALNFDRAIMISAKTGDGTAAITAYQWVGMWAAVATTFNNGSGILASTPGSFVFTGRVISIPGLVGTPGSSQAIGIVARHGLDDFFGQGTIDVNAVATRAMLTDSIARMIGAPRGVANSNSWLRDNGVSLPPGNPQAPIATQEALHLIMIVYEVQTGTSAESIRITNFAVTSNVQELSPMFTTSFRAAIELGIFRETNLQPTASITIGELLDILTALDTLIGI